MYACVPVRVSKCMVPCVRAGWRQLLADGGRRSTVHVLARGLAGPCRATAAASREALSALLRDEPGGRYYG